MPKNSGILFVTTNRNGYLLIEALVALSIFAIGFLAVGTMAIRTTGHNTRSNIMTQAMLLATHTLENFKGIPDITTLVIGDFSDPGPVDANGNPGGIFNRSWSIKDPIGFNTSREIEVTVRWTRQGHPRHIVLSTITKGTGT